MLIKSVLKRTYQGVRGSMGGARGGEGFVILCVWVPPPLWVQGELGRVRGGKGAVRGSKGVRVFYTRF